MILGFILVLCIIGVLLSLTLYAGILPFIGTLGDVKQYNMAYYGAHSSLERWLLVMRYQEIWFQWSGGMGASNSPTSDTWLQLWWFNRQNNGIGRSIIWRWIQIPFSGMGDVEKQLLSGSDSLNYNVLWYTDTANIALWYDSTSANNAYKKDENYVSLSGVNSIKVYARMNPVVSSLFNSNGGISDLANNTDNDNDGLKNDVILSRWWKWLYNNGSQSGDFNILPRSDVVFDSTLGATLGLSDSLVRESNINAVSNLSPTPVLAFDSNINPLFGAWNASSHNIITDNNVLSGVSFWNLLSDISNTQWVSRQQLSLSLFNRLVTNSDQLYPFLEYKIVCDGCDASKQMSQQYSLINGKATIGEYTVTMQAKRLLWNASILSQFTAIF